MFSIYTSGFNLHRGKFDWEGALKSFSQFADEVVIALNTSEDESNNYVQMSIEESQEQTLDYKGVKIVRTNFSYDDPDLDGKVKNAALQATTQEFKIGLDLDERIPLWQYPLWEKAAESLFHAQEVGALMVPSVNLYKDENTVKDIGAKWYLHKHGLYRGVVNFARNPDGTHDITKSDSCELINESGDLIRSASILPHGIPTNHMLKVLQTESYPYVVHYGYVDLERRIELNKSFWKNHWSVEAGRPVDIPTEVAAISEFKSYPHQLRI